jgi:hypothetical protein
MIVILFTIAWFVCGSAGSALMRAVNSSYDVLTTHKWHPSDEWWAVFAGPFLLLDACVIALGYRLGWDKGLPR